MKIHPTAIVHPDARLADDVEVQAYSLIGPHVSIGPGTIVGPHCVIEGATEMGARNRLYSGAQVGVVSQDLKHNPEFVGRVVMGDDNIVREHVTVSASTVSTADEQERATVMGNGCMLMACTHVAHDCHLGDSIILANGALLAGHVTIEDRVNVGGLTGIHQDCHIGTLSFVGGMSRVSKDVPPYMLVEGVPPRCLGPNTVGLKRNGLDQNARKSIKAMYRLLYRSNLNASQAVDAIQETIEASPQRDHFVAFMKNSKRGVILD